MKAMDQELSDYIGVAMQTPFRQTRSSHYSSSCLPLQARPSSPAASSSADDHEAGYGSAVHEIEEEAATDQQRHLVRRAHSCSKLPGMLKLLPSFKYLLQRAHSFSYLPYRHSQSCTTPSATKGNMKRVPRGHVAVYVEPGRERHVVPISYLSHPQFQALLERAESEFGLRPTEPGLRIPCSLSELHHTLHQIRTQ